MANLIESCVNYFGTKDLYVVFGIQKTADASEIQKAYRKISLKVHPDRVPTKEKDEATEKFKVVGKIHSILNDPECRALYDETGVIADDGKSDLEDKDWYSYWRNMFNNITPEQIYEYETKYKDSTEEEEDLIKAYKKGKGNMDVILEMVPYSNPSEEPRLRAIIQKHIDNGHLDEYDCFVNESPRKRDARKRKYEKEAKDAEENSKKQKDKEIEDGALAALILSNKKRGEKSDSFFKHLEEKYSKPKKTRSKKGSK